MNAFSILRVLFLTVGLICAILGGLSGSLLTLVGAALFCVIVISAK